MKSTVTMCAMILLAIVGCSRSEPEPAAQAMTADGPTKTAPQTPATPAQAIVPAPTSPSKEIVAPDMVQKPLNKIVAPDMVQKPLNKIVAPDMVQKPVPKTKGFTPPAPTAP